MHPVAFIDLLTLVTLVGTTISLIVASRRLHYRDPVLIFGFLLFLDLYYTLLFLEWLWSSAVFDRLEDFAGTLVPMWWVFLFYNILQKIGSRKLAHNQRRYQMVVDNISELIVKIDEENRILFASPSFCTIAEKSEEELIGASYPSVMGMEGGHPVLALLDRAKAPPYAAVYETSLQTRRGERWFAWNAIGLLASSETEVRILTVGRDVTEKKTFEAALQESRDLHRQAQRLAKLGHWELQIDSYSISGSEELYRIFEIDKVKPLQWNSFLNGVHPEDRAIVEDSFSQTIESGVEGEADYRFVFPDGRIKFIHSKGHAVSDNTGKIIKIMGTVQDVTNLKEAEMAKESSERKLRQAQKMEAIGTLAGGIAHDFNNILTSLIGFTQIAMAELPRGHAAAGHLDHVLQAGLRARDLVAQILTFSRQSEQKAETTQLNVIIKEVTKLLRATIPANIEIRQKIATRDCFILADPIQIHQILMNLCTNAYQSIGHDNGWISISLEKVAIGPDDFQEVSDLTPGKYAHISVTDTGHGMASETLSKVFDPYFTTKKKGEGTGLGLAVVHGIVREHEGHITVYSEPGRGTSFNVYLPCAEAVKDSCRSNMELQMLTGSEHILIVDDEESILLMMSETLNSLGYRVTTFTQAQRAVEFLQSRPNDCDLVITDLIMPAMNGEELAQRIHQIDPHIPIVIQTGFSDDIRLEGLDSIGVAGVLRKPILRTDLNRCIRRMLENRE